MDPLLDRLLEQAYLFDDPAAYEAGVRDALAVLGALDVAGDPARSVA